MHKIKIDLPNLQKYIDEEYISAQKHKDADLYIYNYSPKTQFESFWNNTTRQCRGLILDGDGYVVARPFKKFHNIGEREDEIIPNEKFTLWEKLDGSLGILYPLKNTLRIATRGSFYSKQAEEANKILFDQLSVTELANLGERVRKQYITVLFEIIYPENRIVVNYGNARKLVHIATIDNKTGYDLPIRDREISQAIRIPQKYTCKLHKLAEMDEPGKEGFVVQFASGLRLKYKFDDYRRLHRLLTGVSARRIWEIMMYETNPERYEPWKGSIADLIQKVPDEFYRWVNRVKTGTLDQYRGIYDNAAETLEKAKKLKFETRREYAEYFKEHSKWPGLCFALLDGKNTLEMIMRECKPNPNTFRIENEDTK